MLFLRDALGVYPVDLVVRVAPPPDGLAAGGHHFERAAAVGDGVAGGGLAVEVVPADQEVAGLRPHERAVLARLLEHGAADDRVHGFRRPAGPVVDHRLDQGRELRVPQPVDGLAEQVHGARSRAGSGP